MKNHKGFILIEILISGIIIATITAASMYLFKVGYLNLAKADSVYILHSKIPLALNLIKNSEKTESNEDLGDGVLLRWQSKLISKSFIINHFENKETKFFVYLYKVYLDLRNQEEQRNYEIYILKYKKIR